MVSAFGTLLAIESATRTAGVALFVGDRVVASRLDESGAHHAVTLLPLVDAVLAEAKIGVDAVDAFALSIGPGSFTSLRIGLATVKGLAGLGDPPVAAVSTLRALAWQAGGASPGVPIAALLDARRGEFYAAGFDASGREVLAEGLYDGDDLPALLPAGSRLVGDGAAMMMERLDAHSGAPHGLAMHPEAARPLEAIAVGELGLELLAAGDGQPASAVLPHYVRRAEAEAKRLGEATEPVPSPS